jgi:threonine dehydrogenase-like Zn-dependent dehydrogenase
VKAIAVIPGQPDSVHLAELPKPDVGVLLEPMSVVEKGVAQAQEIQRRLRVWRPRIAAVLGAGTIGLLATLILRTRGLEVPTFSRAPRPYLNSDLVEALGARYVSTTETSLRDAARLLTHPIRGLENYRQMMDALTSARGAIKVYVDVSDE